MSNIVLFSSLLRIHDSIFPYRNHFSDHVIWFGLQRICPTRGLICGAFSGTWLQFPGREVGDGKERQMKKNMSLPPSSWVLISDSTEEWKLTVHLWVGLWRDARAFSPETRVKGLSGWLRTCWYVRSWDLYFYSFTGKTEKDLKMPPEESVNIML